jgi:F-type H+-transporting ATPase subunit b
MISLLPDHTLVIQWLIFVLVLCVLNFGIFRPILKILRERQNKTKGERLRAEEFEKKAAQLTAQYEEELTKARLQGNQERDRLCKEGEQVYSEIVKATRATEEAKLEEIRSDLAQKRQSATTQLEKTAQDMGQEVATMVLGSRG